VAAFISSQETSSLVLYTGLGRHNLPNTTDPAAGPDARCHVHEQTIEHDSADAVINFAFQPHSIARDSLISGEIDADADADADADGDAMDIERGPPHLHHSLLAVALSSGALHIYRITTVASTLNTFSYRQDDVESNRVTKCERTVTPRLIDGSPILTLGWAPSGQYLAAGNSELVQIWHCESLALSRSIRGGEALLTWRAPVALDGSRAASPAPKATAPTTGAAVESNGTRDAGATASAVGNDEVNGLFEADEQKIESEPSLSWSADGESLALAADKQVSPKSCAFHVLLPFVIGCKCHSGEVSLATCSTTAS
jgi:hypothetical protein